MANVVDLPVLKGSVGGSRIWTHKNGNSPNAARQELDFIFTTDELADEVVDRENDALNERWGQVSQRSQTTESSRRSLREDKQAFASAFPSASLTV
jgi:hypothetical protein